MLHVDPLCEKCHKPILGAPRAESVETIICGHCGHIHAPKFYGGQAVGGFITLPPNDPVNHPRHYTSHRSGVECIDVVEHMTFNVGNAVKYLDLK